MATILRARRSDSELSNTLNAPEPCLTTRPLKRPRLTTGTPDFAAHSGNSSDQGLSLSRRLMLRELGHTSTNLAWQSRWLDYSHEAKLFCSPATSSHKIQLSEFCPANAPFCIESFRTQPLTVVGFEGGDLCMLGSDTGSRQGLFLGNSRNHHNNSIFDLSISHNDSHLASTSGSLVKIYDCERNSVIHGIEAHNDGMFKQCKFHPTNSSLLLTSTRFGTIALHDLRLPTNHTDSLIELVRTKTHSHRQSFLLRKCHDVKSGATKIKRSNVSVTSLAWTEHNEYTAISGGEADSQLKFWDLRSLVSRNRQTPTCIVEPPPSPSGRKFGITSIVADPEDRKIWALCRNGVIYSYHLAAPELGLVDELASEDLSVTSFYCKLAVINPINSNRIAGKYLACGGERGLTLFSKPNTASSTSHSVLLKNGHSRETTGVSYQQCSDSLMSISDDMTLRFWRPDETLYKQLRDQKLGLESNSPNSDGAGWTEIV
ncbi:WD repeat protein Cdt2 [Sugiyamaella lignohabitans]|uniref:WD repeat protein Cdt2 n=1 Tax=Sugiyamaella lignohabitans TaxID=796027 RepID=A0A167CVJ3_9ASCO|nr:WD repeat protein Cdt2 [Sugiyamaella lignohabitans]ANB12155.1 WD repeat protein Cdt2 [Sugiyamaella lignohabitans]